MTEKQRMVFKGVKTLGPISPKKLARRMGYSESGAITQQLTRLKKHSLLKKKGHHKYTTYELNDKFKAG